MQDAAATTIKVSVVVPVYNKEPFLEQCLDSILSQTLKDIEVICVDDGSTDASWDILQRHAAQDSRLSLYQQENRYAGVARNLGKSVAKGKYLVFWDSDDYFAPQALELMYEQCEQDEADICFCAGRMRYDDLGYDIPTGSYVRVKHLPETIPFSRKTAPESVLSVTVEAPWNKMFRREFVEQTGLDFQPIRNGNDVYFVVNAMCLAERITVVRKALIYYRRSQKTGLMATLATAPLTALQAWVDAAENLRKLDAFPERSFANKATDSVIHLLHNMTTWDAFKQGMEFLQGGALDKLAIFERDEDFYYHDWYNDFVKHLRSDTPEEFLAYFSNLSYTQHIRVVAMRRHEKELARKEAKKLRAANTKLTKQAEELEERIADLEAQLEKQRDMSEAALERLAQKERAVQDLKESNSFKVGRAVTAAPRAMKRFTKGKKK